MRTFMNWYCQKVGKTELTQADFEGQAYEVLKALYLDVIHLQYDYLKEITLRRADYQEYTIAEKDFKNLYPSDFEDLNLLLLQGHLNHLPSLDKRTLSTAINLWTRNLVIRWRVKDLQAGIKSYQK
ncbi:hypothetical protein Tco_1071541 [Tanacetum coccineum]